MRRMYSFCHHHQCPQAGGEAEWAVATHFRVQGRTRPHMALPLEPQIHKERHLWSPEFRRHCPTLRNHIRDSETSYWRNLFNIVELVFPELNRPKNPLFPPVFLPPLASCANPFLRLGLRSARQLSWESFPCLTIHPNFLGSCVRVLKTEYLFPLPQNSYAEILIPKWRYPLAGPSGANEVVRVQPSRMRLVPL